MNIVGLHKASREVFESQTYSLEDDKTLIVQSIINDANASNVEIDIVIMTNSELQEYIS
jgi:molecular chaperone DnaK (HSP70)